MVRIFDRKVQFDERSRNFSVRAAIEKKPRSYTWSVGQWLDQGREGACVGFAWAHELIAKPKPQMGVTNEHALTLYREAQKRDAWPGENYDGTSVIAGAKVCKELGYIGEYRWAFGLDELRLALGYAGPVVLGVNWYSGMFDVDSNGYVTPDGMLAGGHAILAFANSEKHKRVSLWNSWGPSWGRKGVAFISYDNLDVLLHEQGEACVPMLRK